MQKASIRMTEDELNREVQRATVAIAKHLKGCDHGMTGSVLGNLLGMYLWTVPADRRAALLDAIVTLANALLEDMPAQAPPEVWSQ